MSRGASKQPYGYQHKQARAKALRQLQDGDPCSRCGGPMYRGEAKALDLDHTDDRTGYRGLAHAYCNRKAGQAKGVRSRTKQSEPKPVINSRVW